MIRNGRSASPFFKPCCCRRSLKCCSIDACVQSVTLSSSFTHVSKKDFFCSFHFSFIAVRSIFSGEEKKKLPWLQKSANNVQRSLIAATTREIYSSSVFTPFASKNGLASETRVGTSLSCI